MCVYAHIQVALVLCNIHCALSSIVQVEPQEKKKKKTGRAKRRLAYNRRFVNVVASVGRKRGPNSNS